MDRAAMMAKPSSDSKWELYARDPDVWRLELDNNDYLYRLDDKIVHVDSNVSHWLYHIYSELFDFSKQYEPGGT
jgi:hypothetical protein